MRNRLMSEMVRNQRPLTIHPRATVAEACRRMSDERVGAVLVTENDGSLVGIFTGRDAVRMLAQGTTSNRPVSEVMTTGPCTIESGCTAIEALRLMWDGGFRHIPILDHGRVVGIVSWGDFRGSERDRLDTELEYWQRI